MTLLEQVTEILSKPTVQWTGADWRVIDQGNREIGRDQMKDILARVGPKD